MKITSEIKSNIIKQYASGFSAREIAKSLHLSHTAVSKILNEIKSCQEEGKVNKSLQKVAKQNNYEIAKRIIDKAMRTVEEDIQKASPMDRIKIVERLTFIYGDNENEKSKLQNIVSALNKISEQG